MTKKLGLVNPAKGVEVPLKEIQTHVCIRGFMANVESVLLYENNESDPIEAQFVFPMDEQSAVYKFEAEIEGRHIVAECQDKQQAKETYDDAVASGQTAMMMSEDDQTGDIFEILLGNLPPNTEAKLTLAYAIELPLESDGTVVFALPTVLNPRYTPAGSKPTKNDDIPYVPSCSTSYSMKFTAKIDGNYVINSVHSKKEKLKVEKSENGKCADVELAEPFTLDHDLTIEINYEGVEKPEIVLEKKLDDGSGLLKEDVLMINFFPEFQDDSKIKGEYVFIIDRSGSMGGNRINKAKETLLLLIKSLPADSMFNIIGFGSRFSSLFDKSKIYDQDSLKEAVKHQKSITADMGGTEILEPLKSVYSKSVAPSYTREVFLLTDGDVSNTREVIALVQKNASTTRVFTFGIGDGASTSLVQNLAKVSGGKATFVKDHERLQSKVISVLKCAMQPSVTDINLEWNLPKGLTALNVPSKPPIVFKGEKMILYTIIQGEPKEEAKMDCSITLRGKIDGKSIDHIQKFDLNTLAVTDGHAPLHRLAAKAQIKELEYEDDADGYYEKKNKEKITLVSTAANVVSRYTAFVGIDKERGQPVEGQSSRRTVPLMESYDYCLKSYGLADDLQLGCGLYSLSDSSSSRKKKSAGFGFSNLFSLPKFNVFKSKKKKKMAPNASGSQDLAYCDMDFDYGQSRSKGDDDNDDGEMQIDNSYSSSKNDDGKMIDLIDLQEFNGTWKISTKLASIFSKSLDDLKKGNVLKADDIWATALAIAWLQRKQTAKRDEWELIETKALGWLTQQDLEGKSVEDIIALASSFLFG